MASLRGLSIAVAVALLLFAAASSVRGAGPGPITFPEHTVASVTFSHEAHLKVEGMACKECHPKVFPMKQGTVKITMLAMSKGEFCGACHDGKRAFLATSFESCQTCHVPAAASPAPSPAPE